MKSTLFIMIKGAGELASAIAHRLAYCGMNIIMTEIVHPTAIRRGVSFAQAVFDGIAICEGITAQLTTIAKLENDLQRDIANSELTSNNITPNTTNILVHDQNIQQKKENISNNQATSSKIQLQPVAIGKIWVIVDSVCNIQKKIHADVLIDATLAKHNIDIQKTHATLVIGIGPGFFAGRNVHYCIETMRGHHLARIISHGEASPDTGIPGDIGGFTHKRVIRAPCEGIFFGKKKIGDIVHENDIVGYMQTVPATKSLDIKLNLPNHLEDHPAENHLEDHPAENNIQVPVLAPLSGVLRGIIYDHTLCPINLKIGDVDPRNIADYCWTISDKARAISGSVLEIIFRHFIMPC